MIKLPEEPKKVRENFLNKLEDFSDNELLKEIVANQHFQMELLDRNRRNTSIIVWVLFIAIILTILSTMSALSKLLF